MTAVIDTNVIVSAFININGIPAKILSLILNGRIKILYDNRIIFEYKEVLSRKEFGFDEQTVNDVMDFIKHEGKYINANHQKVKMPDETDKKFFEVFKSGKAQYLVTGNLKHFPKDKSIVTPKEFIQDV